MHVLLGVAMILQAGAGQPAGQPQVAVSVRPDTVTIGQPITVLIRIRAPAGSTIEFPTGPDSGAAVELLDPLVVSPFGGDSAADPNVVDRVARYRMAAWNTGSQRIELGPATVTTGGEANEFPVTVGEVFVQSVLPTDTAQRVPKPARDLFAPRAAWWWPWLPILLAAALVGGLLWWWWRRRRRRAQAAVALDPYDLAEREFARIEALGLLEAGERGRFVALMVEVMRDYLASRVATAHPSLTSTELIEVMRTAPIVPVERLTPVLNETDLIKFARRPVSAERAREIAREARAIVKDIGRTPAVDPAAKEAA